MDNGDPKINLHINEENLDMIGSNKYLGVQIDSELKWREHITFTIGKISRAMGMLRYGKKYLPLDMVKNMYTSIVEPHFRNCCSVWVVVEKPCLISCKSCKTVPQESLPTALMMHHLFL